VSATAANNSTSTAGRADHARQSTSLVVDAKSILHMIVGTLVDDDR